MSKKNKGFNQPDMPSGINIMGMGGTGEDKSYKQKPAQPFDTEKMKKGNGLKGQ